MLTIKKIAKKIDGKAILNDINLTAAHGEILLLLGASGAGKSTLLRILNNLETADSGTIFFDTKQLSPAILSAKHNIGMVFQHFNLFTNLTVEENIMFALEKTKGKTTAQAKKRATQLLTEYRIEEQATKYPNQLSGGQKQRVALARALALEPDILCLDEPTSALDPQLTNFVAEAISDLACRGYTIIIASHDTRLLQQLNCTIHLMENGTIIESASSKALHNNPEKYIHISKFARLIN